MSLPSCIDHPRVFCVFVTLQSFQFFTLYSLLKGKHSRCPSKRFFALKVNLKYAMWMELGIENYICFRYSYPTCLFDVFLHWGQHRRQNCGFSSVGKAFIPQLQDVWFQTFQVFSSHTQHLVFFCLFFSSSKATVNANYTFNYC